MDEIKLKKAYAAELIKCPDDPFKAALVIFGADTGKALRAATEWIIDSVVVDEKERILGSEDEMAFLPTKADFARDIWQRMEKANFADDYAKLAKLYAEVRGFIQKPETNVNNNFVSNSVMVVKDHGTDDQWEQKLLAQQRKLKEDAKPSAIEIH